MKFNNTQLLDKCDEGVITDVRVTFISSLLEAFMNTFGGYDPDDMSDDYCDEGVMSFQFHHPYPSYRRDELLEWAQDKTGEVSVITCYTLHDEEGSSYCDIYINNDYKDGEFVDWGADYDDTFGEKRLA